MTLPDMTDAPLEELVPQPLEVRVEDLVPGTTYRIDLEDCWITGHFLARFLEHIRDSAGLIVGVRFDTGELTSGYGSWTIRELEPLPDAGDGFTDPAAAP